MMIDIFLGICVSSCVLNPEAQWSMRRGDRHAYFCYLHHVEYCAVTIPGGIAFGSVYMIDWCQIRLGRGKLLRNDATFRSLLCLGLGVGGAVWNRWPSVSSFDRLSAGVPRCLRGADLTCENVVQDILEPPTSTAELTRSGRSTESTDPLHGISLPATRGL